MSDYRLYFLDSSSGRFQRAVDLDAEDDAAAIAMAQEHAGHLSMELWTEARKVRRIEASSDAGVVVRMAQ